MSLDLMDQSRLKTALCFVTAKPDLFRDGFYEWLEANGHIWFEFERHADALWRKGIRHYSAKAIWEVMRYFTTLRDTTETDLKLNNNWTASLARLYLCHHPEREGFFETRQYQRKEESIAG